MQTDLSVTLALLPIEYPGLMELPNEAIYLLGCRSFEQYCGTIRSLTDPERFCPFCVTERARRKQQAERITGGWMLLKNEYPHKNTSQMWLMVPRRHVFNPQELTDHDWSQIGTLFAEWLAMTGVRGGGMMYRFGDPHLNVGTVPHLHVNLIEPIPGKKYRPPFAKNDSEHADDYGRMLDHYHKLLSLGCLDWLFSVEGISATQPPI